MMNKRINWCLVLLAATTTISVIELFWTIVGPTPVDRLLLYAGVGGYEGQPTMYALPYMLHWGLSRTWFDVTGWGILAGLNVVFWQGGLGHTNPMSKLFVGLALGLFPGTFIALVTGLGFGFFVPLFTGILLGTLFSFAEGPYFGLGFALSATAATVGVCIHGTAALLFLVFGLLFLTGVKKFWAYIT